MGVDAPEVLTIRPGETDIYTFELAEELATAETLSAPSIAIDPATDLTDASPTFSGSELKVSIAAAAGVAPGVRTVTLTVNTSLARVLVRECRLEVLP